MIQPITKLVQITPPTAEALRNFNLSDTYGRTALRDQLESDIDEWCAKAFDDGPRTHLGASLIGHECDRHIWYTWRWFKHFIHTGMMQRLFQDGHHYEDRFIQMLRGIGCTYTQVTEDGQQQRISAVEGHFGGSTDGMLTLPPRYGLFPAFLGECKTINKKGFSAFHDVENSKPQHWAQACVYGYMRGLQYAIYFLVGKDDADIAVEVLVLDWELAKRLINKGEWIIRSLAPPPRITNNPSDYRCKMCDHYKLCQLGTVQPDINCRTCKHSQPIENKQWRCNRWNILIPTKEAMLAGCSAHELIVT